jgi:hypothetical protein
MTDAWDCQEARVALGVYVLGAIDPAERALVDAHLATCEACRAELAEFAGLPALLALIPAGEAIALADGLSADDLFPGGDFPADDVFPGHHPPYGADPLPRPLPAFPPIAEIALPPIARTGVPPLGETGIPPAARTGVPPLGETGLPRAAEAAGTGQRRLAPVHDLSAARRRRQRLAWMGAAAAVIVIGAAFFGGTRLAGPGTSPAGGSSQPGLAAQHPNGTPSGPLLTVHGSNGPDTATIAYQSMGWGIQMDALVTGIPVHTRCQMWVVESNGTHVEVGGWQTDAAEGKVWYPASTAVPAASIREFVITVAGGSQITVMPA